MRKAWVWAIIMTIVFTFSFLFLNWSKSEEVQPYRVGVLISGTERLEKINGLKEGLQNLGFIEGMNISYIIKNADNQRKLMEQYANELEKMKLDVIVAGGAIETQFLKAGDGNTSVVFLGVADAVNLNLVESYQYPNGRMTGVENAHVELSGKRLQLFHLLLPNIDRFIIIYDEKIGASLLSLEEVEKVAKELKIKTISISVSNQEQLSNLQSSIFNANDGMIVLPSYYLEGISSNLAKIALNKKIPIFGVNKNDILNGFLLSYGVSYYDQGYQAANMVSKILNGLPPSKIPVEKPDSVKLLANSKTERKLGITFSRTGNSFIQRINEY